MDTQDEKQRTLNSIRSRTPWPIWMALALALLPGGGCRDPDEPGVVVLVPAGDQWQGVVVRQFPALGTRVSLLDVDLRTPGIEAAVVPTRPEPDRGSLYGPARTLPEWLAGTGAIAGVNGGFFGKETATGEKEILGLFVQDGRSLAATPPIRARSRSVSFTRACFGLEPSGEPWIAWASSLASGAVPRRHDQPEVSGAPAEPWPVRSALACGPRLIQDGRRRVTDRQERLVSPGTVPRTFIGFSRDPAGEPRHLILATAGALDFTGSAQVLEEYCRREHRAPCSEAMALDGGASTQLAYRTAAGIVTARPSPVTVPTAVLIRQTRRVATTR